MTSNTYLRPERVVPHTRPGLPVRAGEDPYVLSTERSDSITLASTEPEACASAGGVATETQDGAKKIKLSYLFSRCRRNALDPGGTGQDAICTFAPRDDTNLGECGVR